MARRFGTRCGKLILPEVLREEPILMKPRKGSCNCGHCRNCVQRVYARVWWRNNKREKPLENEDKLKQMDADAEAWLKEKGFR